MAKLKAPLLSLGASGAIGKTIVYANWKGLDIAREWVRPTNPNTTPQQTQRGYLKACVAMIHYAQGLAANPLVEADASAYALLASLYPTPLTWFNAICRQWLNQRVASKHPSIYHGGGAVAGSEKLTVTMQASSPEVSISDGLLVYGTSRSALIRSLACTFVELNAGKEIPSLTAGIKYFVQFKPTLPVEQAGANSGIFYGTPTA